MKEPDQKFFEWLVLNNQWRGFFSFRVLVRNEAEIGIWRTKLYNMLDYGLVCGFILYLEVDARGICHFHALTACDVNKKGLKAIRESVRKLCLKVNGSTATKKTTHYREVSNQHDAHDYALKDEKGNRASRKLKRGWSWSKVKGRFYRYKGLIEPLFSIRELTRNGSSFDAGKDASELLDYECSELDNSTGKTTGKENCEIKTAVDSTASIDAVRDGDGSKDESFPTISSDEVKVVSDDKQPHFSDDKQSSIPTISSDVQKAETGDFHPLAECAVEMFDCTVFEGSTTLTDGASTAVPQTVTDDWFEWIVQNDIKRLHGDGFDAERHLDPLRGLYAKLESGGVARPRIRVVMLNVINDVLKT